MVLDHFPSSESEVRVLPPVEDTQTAADTDTCTLHLHLHTTDETPWIDHTLAVDIHMAHPFDIVVVVVDVAGAAVAAAEKTWVGVLLPQYHHQHRKESVFAVVSLIRVAFPTWILPLRHCNNIFVHQGHYAPTIEKSTTTTTTCCWGWAPPPPLGLVAVACWSSLELCRCLS